MALAKRSASPLLKTALPAFKYGAKRIAFLRDAAQPLRGRAQWRAEDNRNAQETVWYFPATMRRPRRLRRTYGIPARAEPHRYVDSLRARSEKGRRTIPPSKAPPAIDNSDSTAIWFTWKTPPSLSAMGKETYPTSGRPATSRGYLSPLKIRRHDFVIVLENLEDAYLGGRAVLSSWRHQAVQSEFCSLRSYLPQTAATRSNHTPSATRVAWPASRANCQ